MIEIALFFMSVAAIAASVAAWISIKDADRCWGWFLEAKEAALQAEKKLKEVEEQARQLAADRIDIVSTLEDLIEEYRP